MAASVTRTAHVRADRAAVFDLISRVEDFSSYSHVIRSVRCLAPGLYRWVVGVAGIELEWDSVVTEARRPERFAWESVRGVQNGGCFVLEPCAEGTEIRFTMEYRLASPILERIVGAVAEPVMEKVASELLDEVRRRLEQPANKTLSH